MQRRDAIKAGLVTGVATLTTGFRPIESADSSHYYELRTYELRSDVSSSGLRNFYRDALIPAYSRAGAGVIGLFTAETGFPTASLIVFIDYPSLDAVRTVNDALEADETFIKARQTFETGAELPYLRYDSSLMRAFNGLPKVDVPARPTTRPARVFELRTYEARSASALARKIAMFNEVEIELFRSIGMPPVFLGENIFGTRLPSLTYMLSFENMDARYKAWDVFGKHPDWIRANRDPKYAATGSVIVTNVAYLRPLAFSQIR